MWICIDATICRPLPARGPAKHSVTNLSMTDLSSYLVSISHHQFSDFQVSIYKLAIDQSAGDQLVITLLFAALQISNLGLVIVVPYHPTATLTSTMWVLSTWGVSGETLKGIEISSNLQHPKKSSQWGLKTPKRFQNDVPRGT